MLKVLRCATVLASIACGKDESAPTKVAPEPSPTSTQVAPPKPESPPDASTDDGSAEIARMVVHDVGSKNLGNQTIDPACVSVALVPTGEWTVAAARLEGCGDKTARSIVWLYKRRGNGKWNEDYVGQPPKCWRGVPPDIAPAVAIATKIKTC